MQRAHTDFLLFMSGLILLAGCWLPERKIWNEDQARIEHIARNLMVPGEKLTFAIHGGIFTLGRAELTMKVSEKNNACFEVALFANSTHPWLPALSYSYKSTINRNDFSTVLFEMEEMEKSAIKKSITFRTDYSLRKAEYEIVKNKNSRSGVLTVEEKVYDYVSLIYLLRKDLPAVGRQKEIPLFNETGIADIRVRNLARRELVLSGIGKFQAFMLKPKRRLEGIFFKQGDIILWIDETYRIPLRIIIKFPFGVGRIDLIKAENMQTGETFIP